MSYVGPGAPYVSPAMLMNAPTGISWKTIPGFNSTATQQLVEATNLCRRASDALDAYCQTALRATVNTEVLYGPGDPRCVLMSDNTMRLIMSRPTILEVVAGSVQPRSAFPIGSASLATTIPANMMAPEHPVMGIYGSNAPGAVGEPDQSIIIGPGYGSWAAGRGGLRFSITYMNGYPHCSLLAAYSSGVSSIHVDDITGMVGSNTGSGAPGAFCTFYATDDSLQESNTVTSVTPDTTGAISGPGMLHLANPTVNSHAAGELFTTLPATVQQAAILMATSMALVRGGTATTVQAFPGASGGGGGGTDLSPAGLADEAEILVTPYRRVW